MEVFNFSGEGTNQTLADTVSAISNVIGQLRTCLKLHPLNLKGMRIFKFQLGGVHTSLFYFASANSHVNFMDSMCDCASSHSPEP